MAGNMYGNPNPMDLETVIQNEVVRKRKTNIIQYHLSMESRKKLQVNLFASRDRDRHRRTKLMDTMGKGKWDGYGDWQKKV